MSEPSGLATHEDFDPETAALIAKLALDDLAEFLPADCLPRRLDEELVHKLQAKEYNEWFSVAQDAKVTKTEEKGKEGDPAMDDNPSDHTELDIVENGLPDEAIETQASGESSNAGPSTKKWVDCVTCGDACRDHETFNTPCGHYHCGDCLVEWVEAFTRDESLFPLRCCQDDPISIEEVLPNLSLDLRTLFKRKHEEFSVLPKNRLYCSNLTCSTFLGSSENLVSKIECPTCLVGTCPQCKELAHPGEGCEVNASYKALQELAKSKEWQTCPGCKALVELSTGCFHMTCRCKAQFCYLCAARWRSCACVQWNEIRL